MVCCNVRQSDHGQLQMQSPPAGFCIACSSAKRMLCCNSNQHHYGQLWAQRHVYASQQGLLPLRSASWRSVLHCMLGHVHAGCTVAVSANHEAASLMQ